MGVGEELLVICDWLLGEEQEAAAFSYGSASVSTAVSRILRDTFSMTGRAMRPRSADSLRKMIEPRMNAKRNIVDRGSWIADGRSRRIFLFPLPITSNE